MKLLWSLNTAVNPDLLALTQAAADCAELMEGVTRSTAVAVLLCDDEEIHRINREQRGVDRATDVLSFPTLRYPKGKTLREADRQLRSEYDPELDACLLGDLVISVPHALAQAEEYGHSPQRELAYLLIHGICHLMGYDHMEEEEKRQMRAMEEQILSAVGQTREDNGQISDEALLALARKARERSYSPYSGYAVGAALLCANGRVYLGCNIENASFGVTNCAERTALFKAVSEGEREFTAIAIASEGSAPWPCGVCRQALHEFAPALRVLVTWDGQSAEKSLLELLPCGFGPEDVVASK